MEIQIPYSIFFTFLFFLFMIYKLSGSKKPLKALPPGPKKLPFIGNLHEIGSLPHRSLRDLSNKYGPMMHLQLGQVSNFIVSSPEVAEEVMKTHDTIFANRPLLFAANVMSFVGTDIGFSPYGSYWRQIRKICTLELLSAKRVQTYRNIREEEVSKAMKDISEHPVGSVLNLTKILHPLTNSIVARAAFGKKTKNVEQIIPAMISLLNIVGGFSIEDVFPSLRFLAVISGTKSRCQKVVKRIENMLNNIINDHMEKKSGDIREAEDIVDVLLRIQREKDLEIPLTLDNVKAVLLDMFIGGTETAATTTEWAIAELIRNPEVMKKAQEEVRKVYGNKGYVDESELHQLEYLSLVIRETLRLHPPLALLLPRENSEVCQINGYEVPLKSKVIINGWAIGRDPKYWDEPEKFQPERFINKSYDYKGTNFEYIPFGAGRRICPGISFVTPILDLIIASLLYHFNWEVPNGEKNEEFDMTESFGVVVKRKQDLCLVPIAYRP